MEEALRVRHEMSKCGHQAATQVGSCHHFVDSGVYPVGRVEALRYFLSLSLPQDHQDDLRQVLDRKWAIPAATLKDATHIITTSH